MRQVAPANGKSLGMTTVLGRIPLAAQSIPCCIRNPSKMIKNALNPGTPETASVKLVRLLTSVASNIFHFIMEYVAVCSHSLRLCYYSFFMKIAVKTVRAILRSTDEEESERSKRRKRRSLSRRKRSPRLRPPSRVTRDEIVTAVGVDR